MDQIIKALHWLSAHWETVPNIVAYVVTVAYAITKLTKTQEDDMLLAAVVGILQLLGIYKGNLPLKKGK